MTAAVDTLALCESLRATADRLAAHPVEAHTDLARLGYTYVTLSFHPDKVHVAALRPMAAGELDPPVGKRTADGHLYLSAEGPDAPSALADLLALARQAPTPGVDPETPAVDLHKILADHAKWLNGTGGKRANLRTADLRGADLRGANLRSANLRSANLSGANLSGAYLYGACLTGAFADVLTFLPRGYRVVDGRVVAS